VAQILRGPEGLAFQAAAMLQQEGVDFPGIEASQVVTQNVAFELAERSEGVKYPAFYVYCDKIKNQLREKFRNFSGTASMAIEVRVTKDRLGRLEWELQSWVEAVTQALDANRGDWGQGMFFGGVYEVTFGAVKHGGKNFVEVAKVTFDVDVSAS
jgi:hypothetical protein